MPVGKFDNVVIDGATVYYTSVNITDPKVSLASLQADYLGTAKSSVTVLCKPIIREIEHMGKMGRKTSYDERITGYEVEAEADLMDVTSKTLNASLLVKDTTTVPTAHDRYIPSPVIAAVNYKHLVIVGKLQGSAENVVCIVKNTYNSEGLSIEFKDNDESASKMKFIGHYAIDSDIAPYQLYIPKTV